MQKPKPPIIYVAHAVDKDRLCKVPEIFNKSQRIYRLRLYFLDSRPVYSLFFSRVMSM